LGLGKVWSSREGFVGMISNSGAERITGGDGWPADKPL
jgi:hypothetical protein